MKNARLKSLKMFSRFIGKVPIGHLGYMFWRMFNERPHWFDGQVRIDSFFPPYPSDAFDRFCGAIINRWRVPLSTYLAVTHECPYKCEHCSCDRQADENSDTKKMLKLIDEIRQIGTCTLGFTGGEPLIREDICELVSHASKSMNTIIFTTGYGLDDQLASKLKKAGVGCVTVGIESGLCNEHDEVRKSEGSFKQAQKAIENCKRAGIYTAISTIATHEKIKSGELEKMHALGKVWNVGEFRILSPVATGRKLCDKQFWLSNEELDYLKKFHISHNRRKDGPVAAAFAYLESPEMFGCGGGYHHLFIDANGNVCPCDLAPLSFANVFKTPLEQIWADMEKYFARPRKTCIMKTVANKIEQQPLPTNPEISKQLVGEFQNNTALPEVYRRLFKRPK